ncbi:MAG: GTP cyclohydrolase II [Gammaproteobacteria bacterium]|nr:GTP cyclohydrolase II [Gammaproteobacteria bacterium]NKB62977.1 GTP cyclohydrolase II [Gammaproteobacteria bacterium]
MREPNPPMKHIVLTSHPTGDQTPIGIQWGAPDAARRGPVVATPAGSGERNAIGAYSGSYAVYRALAVAAGSLDPLHKPDLTNTAPAMQIGPFVQWSDPHKIVSIDPWGHVVGESFASFIEDGVDVRPTIAITRARLSVPELINPRPVSSESSHFESASSKSNGDGDSLKPDGVVLLESGEVNVIKIAIEPVWYLPGIAERFNTDEHALRRTLFEQTGGMFSELVTRPDLKVFLPPIGGITAYVFGEIEAITDPAKQLSCRVHDECNGSDVFGSDICTCRPYLVYGIKDAIASAQQGGAGLIIYNRKEGRALGEVTKFLVYNARKRQTGGDTAEHYFERTECVAGVQDMRFQELMPDVLNWLGITRIDRFISMSNMKYDAVTSQGIEIIERVPIPEDSIPPDAKVEMDAKKAAGYFTDGDVPTERELQQKHGRDLEEY